MHYPDTRWRPCCQGKSRDDVSGRIENNIDLLIYLLLKEVRNPNLGLWVSQSLDGVTSQKHRTVIRESIIKS